MYLYTHIYLSKIRCYLHTTAKIVICYILHISFTYVLPVVTRPIAIFSVSFLDPFRTLEGISTFCALDIMQYCNILRALRCGLRIHFPTRHPSIFFVLGVLVYGRRCLKSMSTTGPGLSKRFNRNPGNILVTMIL
jgi:hypothetical protein